MSYLIIIITVFMSFSVNAGEKLNAWVVYSSHGLPASVEKSTSPVEGGFVAAIKPPMLSFDKKNRRGYIDKYHFGWLDYYYLAQTVNCKKMKGNHFHISGYLKLNPEQIIKHNEAYKKWRLEKLAEYYQAKKVEVNKDDLEANNHGWDIANLLSRTKVNLNVFLTTDRGLSVYDETSKFSTSSKEWQRLNVEVDIPKDCKSVTIAVRLEGIGNLYIDDFVSIEHGENTQKRKVNKPSFRLAKKFDEMIELWVGNSNNKYEFENMGFEQSKKTN